MVYEYAWKKGARMNSDPNKIGEELQSLGNEIEPERLVRFACDTEKEVHKCFTWDNKLAGEKLRLSEARHILNSIVTVMVRDVSNLLEDEENTVQIRAYENVMIENGNGECYRAYVPTIDALSDEELRKQVMGRLFNAIATIRKIIQDYKFLGSKSDKINNHLDEIKESLLV